MNFNRLKPETSEKIVEKLVLLDLQLIKYARPTVDLAYFIGSSTSPSFRAANLKKCLEFYHEALTQELEAFGYKTVYSLDLLKSDFQDCWMFGYFVGCMHVQVRKSFN